MSSDTMTSICFDCGNKIRAGHNSRWNLREAGVEGVKVTHIDDVCECDEPLRLLSSKSLCSDYWKVLMRGEIQ